MPNLTEFRRRGTWFERSHCAFPSVTRVNAASLATGSYPAVHGIPSNTLFLPERDLRAPFATTGDAAVLRSLRQRDGTPLLVVETAAEVLARAGRRTLAVSTGSPGSGYLLHPEVRRTGGAVYHYSFSEPDGLARRVQAHLGVPPGEPADYSLEALCGRVRRAGRATLEVLVPEVQPDLVYFWCTVPDALHHRYGLGSAEASDGIRVADQVFRDLLTGLTSSPQAPPNVIVTADHGYETIERHVDVAAELAAGGFQVNVPGGVYVSVDGGAAHLFCRRADDDELRRIVAFLAGREWVSALFAREAIPGALPLSVVSSNCDRAADVVACLAWRDGDNGRGVNGLGLGGGQIALGAGDHGGGSPFEMRNTLIASGPAFRAGVSIAAAGIVDIAPTICRVLGLDVPARWSGRVLGEALVGGVPPAPEPDRTIRSEAAASGFVSRATLASSSGTQYLSRAG